MRKIAILAVFVPLATLALGLRLQSSSLYLNGSLASSGMIERNGIAYVPLKDVASAFKLSVQKTARGFELSDAGGANQVNGISGKVGDMLYNGFVRFEVVKIERPGKSYTRKFTGDNSDVQPIPQANELVLVVCKFKNALQKTIGPTLVGGDATALTDKDGHSYPARRISDIPPFRDMLPGALADFALIFDVPPGVKLQDLVYQPNINTPADAQMKKFRVSLGEAGSSIVARS